MDKLKIKIYIFLLILIFLTKINSQNIFLERPDQDFILPNGLQVVTKKTKNSSHINMQLGFKNFDYLSLTNKESLKESLYISDILFNIYLNRNFKNFLSKNNYSSYQIDINLSNKILFKTVSCNLEELLSLLDLSFNEINSSNFLNFIIFNNIKNYVYNYTRDQFKYFIKNYINPENFYLIIIGDIDQNNLKNILERSFNRWKSKKPENTFFNKTEIPEINNPESTKINKPIFSNNINNLFAFRLSDYKNSSDNKILELLEDFFKSQIVELRQNTGLFYGYYISFKNTNNYLIKDYICLNIIFNSNNYITLENKLKNLLNNLSNSLITEEQLNILKKSVLIKYSKLINSDQDYAYYYSLIISRNLSWDYFDNRIKDIQNISLKQVNSCIKKYFDPTGWTFEKI